jgi:hypothetical protein
MQAAASGLLRQLDRPGTRSKISSSVSASCCSPARLCAPSAPRRSMPNLLRIGLAEAEDDSQFSGAGTPAYEVARTGGVLARDAGPNARQRVLSSSRARRSNFFCHPSLTTPKSAKSRASSSARASTWERLHRQASTAEAHAIRLQRRVRASASRVAKR